MPSGTEILVGSDPSKATVLAAEKVVEILTASSGTRSIALAGGSTPRALYALLASSPWRERADWRDMDWFWGDERTVPPDHPDSNYRMAREALLDPLGIDPAQVHRMPAEASDLTRAAADYETLIRRRVRPDSHGIPAFDLVLLGIGSDGHTASLFPGSAGLTERSRLIVAHEVPSQRAWRMTMTYPLLRAARNVLFFVTGAAKADVLARIHSPNADPFELPAAGLRTASGRVTWVLDADAARLVQETLRP